MHENSGESWPFKDFDLESLYIQLTNDVYLASDFSSTYASESFFVDHSPLPDFPKGDASFVVYQLWVLLFSLNALFLKLGAMLGKARLAAVKS